MNINYAHIDRDGLGTKKEVRTDLVPPPVLHFDEGRPGPPVCGSRFVVREGDWAPAYRCASNWTAFTSGSREWSKETVGKER